MDSVGLDLDELDFIGGFNQEIKSNDECINTVEKLTIESILPKEGLYLGLDISKNSSGVTLIDNGKRLEGNITLTEPKGVHKEVLYRRALKEDLRELVTGKDFDAIVIEDVFDGDNPSTVRLLLALNTAIDEMILDGECTCKEFIRVSNKTWKSWLYVLDSNNITRGFNDKEKIKYCLESIGVVEEGKGYQDRLDSLGMLVGYFLKGKELNEEGKLTKKKKVNIKDIEAAYDVDTSYLFIGRDDVNKDNIEFLDCNRISKKMVIDLLTEKPKTVFITSNVVQLGNLGIDLDLGIIDEGGYFAFWVKSNKIKKYLK